MQFKSLVPILIGFMVTAILFVLGDRGDALGLILMGGTVGFLLVLWGVYNSGLIRQVTLVTILKFFFGMGIVLVSIVLFIDDEFGNATIEALMGVTLGIALIVFGVLNFKRIRK